MHRYTADSQYRGYLRKISKLGTWIEVDAKGPTGVCLLILLKSPGYGVQDRGFTGSRTPGDKQTRNCLSVEFNESCEQHANDTNLHVLSHETKHVQQKLINKKQKSRLGYPSHQQAWALSPLVHCLDVGMGLFRKSIKINCNVLVRS